MFSDVAVLDRNQIFFRNVIIEKKTKQKYYSVFHI